MDIPANINISEESEGINASDSFKKSMKLREVVNVDTLRIIRDNFTKLFKECYKGEMRVFDPISKKYVVSTDEKTCLTLIDKYYKQKVKTPEVEYRYIGREKSGRRYSVGTSLQGICRKIRHTISHEYYYDVDIKNAHPVFELAYCRKYNINHPMLQQYVEGDREAFLDLLIGREVNKTVLTASNREDRKAFILKMLNGGGGSCKDVFQVPEMKKFYEDQQAVIDHFWNNPNNKKYTDMANVSYDVDGKGAKKGYDNRRGSALNYYLCDIEDKVLELMERFFSQRNISYGAFCFDGMMVEKKDVSREELLNHLTTLSGFVEGTMGLKLKFEIKEMDEFLNLEGLSPRDSICMRDEFLADMLLENIKDDILYSPSNKDFYLYSIQEALWKKSEFEMIKNRITENLIPYIETSPDPEEIKEALDSICSDKKQNSIVAKIRCRIKELDHDDIISKYLNQARGLFPISNNQVFDFKKGLIIPREKSHYFTQSTKRVIKNLSEIERENVLTYFTELMSIKDEETGNVVEASSTHRDCFISVFAGMLTGDFNEAMKKFVCLIGGGDNGKTIFINLISAIFDKFHTPLNARAFEERKNKNGHDTELFSCIGKRMFSLSELGSDKAFDEENLKRITGSDEIQIRRASASENVAVKFIGTPVLATNAMPEFREPAFKERLLCFNFGNKFVKSATFNEGLMLRIDDYFTVLCEYAIKFYADDKTISISEEALKYSNQIKTEGDPFYKWLAEQTIFVNMKKEMENSLNNPGEQKINYTPKQINDDMENRVPSELLTSSYEMWCKSGNVQKVDGRNSFLKKFKKEFGVDSKKERSTWYGEEKNISCYRGFRKGDLM